MAKVKRQPRPGVRPDGVSISGHNKKMGHIPSVSLPPILSCVNCELCKDGCYAKRMERRHPNTKAAWARNWRLYNESPSKYFLEIKEFLISRKASTRLFRWHVSGDIPDARYIDGMDLAAMMFPDIEHLCFTKNYYVVDYYVKTYAKRDNLHIILSGWPGLEMVNPHGLPVAWMQDGTEDRIPEDAIECTGKCDACGMCWQLDKLGKDVYFNKH